MKILNLYAGIGGNRKLWTDCHVTAVENNPQIASTYQGFFPADTVVVDDAHTYLEKHYSEFDFIWSSPPCQSHSKMMKATRHNTAKYFDASLYQEIVFLQNFYSGLFVVENVRPYYKPLITPTCEIGRHIFWANFYIDEIDTPRFEGKFITAGTVNETKALKKWLGLEYEGNLYYKPNHCPGQILRNCVHPLLGKHIQDRAKIHHTTTQSAAPVVSPPTTQICEK